MTSGSMPSGWYDDPSGEAGRLRWWDGTSWTEHFHSTDTLTAKTEAAGATDTVQLATVRPGTPADNPPKSLPLSKPAGSSPRPVTAAKPVAAAKDAPTAKIKPVTAASADAPGPVSAAIPAPVPPSPSLPEPVPVPQDQRQFGLAVQQPQPVISTRPATGTSQPGVSRPVVPQSVVFETVDPNSGRKRLLFGAGALVLAVATAIGGYFLGTSHSSHGGSKTVAGPSTSPGPAQVTGGNPNSPDGFMGTAIVGGKSIAGGQKLGGPTNKMTFSVPSGWQAQYDPTAPGDLRYAVDPYVCSGHGTGDCQRGLVVANTRSLVGSWTTPQALVIGMGQVRYAAQLGLKTVTAVQPMKQQAFTLDGRPAYLALWHVPLLSSSAVVPDSYCGVLTVTPAPGAKVLPVLQICLDDSQSGPALATMDQIADSVQVLSQP